MTGHLLELLKGEGFVNCFHTELEKSDNEEENVEREAVQSGDDEVQQLKKELLKTRSELDVVKAELARTAEELRTSRYDEVGFKENNDKVLYYTGLPTWEILLVLFTFLQKHLPVGRRVLSPFQQLLMTLMRLRLNLPSHDVAYRFGVHQSTVSRTFLHVIDAMYVRLKPLIRWPERNDL